MPRKLNPGAGYYDDYNDFDDEEYDYDDDFDAEDNVEVESNIETKKLGVWSCSICTYDNEDGMLSCDICGVLRNPLPNNTGSTGKRTVHNACKDTEASLMAKSLFASLPHPTQKNAVISQMQKDQFGNDKGPFKFDTPSPDDLVSNGLRATKVGSKVPSQSVAKERNRAKSVEINIDSDEESSSTSRPKSRRGNLDDDNGSSVNKGKLQGLAGSLTDIGLEGGSGNPSNVNIRKATSSMQYKPETWMLYNKTEDQLIQLNLAIVGHVDSGKSTLSGRLLHLSGQISQKQMHKYEKDAKIQGKGSFAYAWALDETAEERERGITMDVAIAYFDSKRYHVVVLDSPGHKDLVRHMISGATQADVAILVVDASVGSFEAGMDGTKGQTKEHARLIRSSGVEQVIVAVNKMDVVGYSKDRFDLIKEQVGVFLHSCGFKNLCVSWLPLSAMENQNLYASPSDARLLSWYDGPHLLDAVDSLQPPSRDLSKPLLMPIYSVKSASPEQVFVCGKLEAGALRSGSKVLVLPSGEVGTIRSLERDSRGCPVARAGDNITVSLQCIDTSNVIPGGVLCHPEFPVNVATHLEVKILVLDVATPILLGSQLEFHIHQAMEPMRVVKILSLLDPKTGKVTKKAPRVLVAKQSAMIEVRLRGPVCVDVFSNSKALGRVFLRALGGTIAVGIITRVIG